MGTSKTARASMVQTVGEKKVIPDEVYIRNLRYDVNNGIHATQEGAKALLRAYDAALNTIGELNERVNLLEIDGKSQESLIKDLIAAKDKLQAEFDTLLKNAVEQVVATAEATLQQLATPASGCTDTTGEGGVGHEGPCSHD